jgi:hypothetical protein
MSTATSTAPSLATLRRLRPAVHIAPVPEGLLFIGWQESMVVHGSQSLSRLWDALFPHLHRGVDIHQLLEALPESARPVAQLLLDQLDESGFLLREQAAMVETSGDVVHPEHERTRAFLDASAADPAAAQERLRTSPVMVRGHGVVAVHAARSLLRLGAGDVIVTDLAARQELVALAVEHGATLRSEAAGTPAVTITVDETSTPYSGACVGVLQLGDHALVGPLQSQPQDPGVGVALQRLRARGDDAPIAPAPAVAARLAGGLAALQVAHHLFGITTEYDGMTYLVDAARLATSTHPVFQNSAVPVRPLSQMAPPGADKEVLEELTDERTGILPQLLPLDLPQTPLALVQTDAGSKIVGWATSGAVARYRLALESARTLAEATPARVWTAAGEESQLPTSLLTTAAGRDIDGMLGHGLQRLLALILANPVERARRLGAEAISPLLVTDVPGPLHDALVRLAVRNTVDLTSTVSRLLAAPSLLCIVEVTDTATGRVLAVAAATDDVQAQAAAVDHVTAALAVAEESDVVAQLASPPWADGGEVTLGLEDVYALLSALCLPDETPVTGRWSSEPATDRLGVIGWVGIATIDAPVQGS